MRTAPKNYLIQLLISLVIIMYLGTACTDTPSFEKEPKIIFKSINIGSETQGLDTINITISFQDGDGDLGLRPDETEDQYGDSINVDGINVKNRFFFNFFIDTYKFEEGEYQKLENIELDGRFPLLNTKEGSSPIEGEIAYRLQLFLNLNNEFRSGDILKFDISIADRALNVSNIVKTDSVVLGSTL